MNIVEYATHRKIIGQSWQNIIIYPTTDTHKFNAVLEIWYYIKIYWYQNMTK